MEHTAKTNVRVILKELETGIRNDNEWTNSVGTLGCYISFTEEHDGDIIYIAADITVDPNIGIGMHHTVSYTLYEGS